MKINKIELEFKMTVKNDTDNNNTDNNNTVEGLSWKQGKAVVKWGASSNGLKLNLPEIKVSKADLASAKKIVNGWKKPVQDAIPGVAHWVSVAKTLTSLGLSKKSRRFVMQLRTLGCHSSGYAWDINLSLRRSEVRQKKQIAMRLVSLK